jgi:predicted adenylyl cyclase CyaB
MRQIEITVRVNNSMEEVDKILSNQGFKIIRKSHIKDIYKSELCDSLKESNILELLSKSILIRYLSINGEQEFKKLTYKKKTYDGSTVISEEKISVNIDDIDNANKLLEALGFKTLVNVNYDVIVYSNDKLELCFQSVENLGLLLEYENESDFKDVSNEDIMKEKNKMLEKIKQLGLNISTDIDVKKAFELIKNNLNKD